MFPLLKYFSIASAVTIGLVTIFLAYVDWKIASSELVNQVEVENSNLALVLSNTVWPPFANHIISARNMDGATLRAHSKTAEIHRALKTLTNGLPVLKIKIYNLTGLTVYSSEPGQIGESKIGNLGFVTAIATQQPISKLSYRDRFSAFSGIKTDRSLVESYLPIFSPDGSLVSVFELYTDVTSGLARVKRSTTNHSIILLGVFFILYGVLFFVVRRADRILKEQYEEQQDAQVRLRSVMSALVEANGSLDRRVSERTQVLKEEIEERERAEADMRFARDEAREANDAKTKFLSSMSHELRTPLNAILGFAQLIESDPEFSLSEMQADNMREVIQAGDHLLALIDNVLDLSYIEVGSMDLVLEPVDTRAVLDESLGLIKPQAEGRSISLIDLSDSPELPWIQADRVRVKQVLVNVLTNAFSFSQSGGRVEVSCAETNPGSLRISIMDTGVGISSGDLTAIFDPFFRSANPGKTVDGVGIGLAIARQLTEAMGGTIGVDSEPDRGSTFWIELPIIKPDVITSPG